MINYRNILPLFCFLCSPGVFLASLWTRYHTEFFFSCQLLYLNTFIFLATLTFHISRLEYLTFFLTYFSTTNVSLNFNCRVLFLSLLNWIGHVNRMDSKRKVSEVYNNNSPGSRLIGRPKNRWRNCAKQILINTKLQIGKRGKKSWLGEVL